MPDTISETSFIPRLEKEKEALQSFVQEAEQIVEAMNVRVRGSVEDTLEGILRDQLRRFSRVLEVAIQDMLEDAFLNADATAPSGIGRRGNQRGVSSRLQTGVDLFRILERAKRNL